MHSEHYPHRQHSQEPREMTRQHTLLYPHKDGSAEGPSHTSKAESGPLWPEPDPTAHLLPWDTRGSPSVTAGLAASGNLLDLKIYTERHRFEGGAMNAMHLPALAVSMADSQT